MSLRSMASRPSSNRATLVRGWSNSPPASSERLQGEDRLPLLADGLQGDALFHARPNFGPMVGRSNAAREIGPCLTKDMIALGHRAEQSGPAADGQRGAADDLLHVDLEEHRPLHDAALLHLWADIDLAEGDEHRLRIAPARACRLLAPQGTALRALAGRIAGGNSTWVIQSGKEW